MIAIISLVNNAVRTLVNGSWTDKMTLVNNEQVKEFNPKSIDIRFKGKLTSAELSTTKLFTNGYILGSELRAINAHIGASNDKYNTDKLQLVDEAEYHIVAKATKGSTRKSKFRTATFDNGDTVTFVTVAVPLEREPSVGVECSI
tara:strand:- start:242 stop:676 length:435 start_codon:yes stop_codon:yes gene_type:complete